MRRSRRTASIEGVKNLAKTLLILAQGIAAAGAGALAVVPAGMASDGRGLLIALSAAVVLLTAVCAAQFARLRSRTLGAEPAYLAGVAERLAAGDFSAARELGASPSGTLAASLNTLSAKLGLLMQQMKHMRASCSRPWACSPWPNIPVASGSGCW